jgi:hypothetical protein
MGCAYGFFVERLTVQLAARVRRLAPEVDAVTALAIAEEAIDVLQPRLVDAATVASTLGVSREWVYANASRLGGRAIGAGKVRPRLRFYLHEVGVAIEGMKCRSVVEAESPRPPRRRAARPHAEHLTPSGNPRLEVRER